MKCYKFRWAGQEICVKDSRLTGDVHQYFAYGVMWTWGRPIWWVGFITKTNGGQPDIIVLAPIKCNSLESLDILLEAVEVSDLPTDAIQQLKEEMVTKVDIK